MSATLRPALGLACAARRFVAALITTTDALLAACCLLLVVPPGRLTFSPWWHASHPQPAARPTLDELLKRKLGGGA
jgi:hypothetical protein